MSETEKKIITSANITMGASFPVDGDKIKQVIVAYKLTGKGFTSAALKKLLKRYSGDEPTEDEIKQFYDDAGAAYNALIALRVEEKNKISNIDVDSIPPYVFMRCGSEGEPNGYALDLMKYSDYIYKELRIHNLANNLYVYDDKAKIFEEHVNQIQTHIRDTVKKYDINTILGSTEAEMLTHLKSMGCVKEYPFVGKIGTIHVSNGSFDMATGNLSPTTPDMLYDYCIETEYHTFPDGTPELDNFLKLYGTTAPIDVLAKTIWQRAHHDTLKELTVFLGARDCGKTTCAELIQCTISGDINNRSNVSRILLHELLQRFGYASLEGKLINFGDDLPDTFVKNAGRINELVGSIVRHIEKKGVTGYDAIVTAYYLFTANNLPPLDDDDNAVWGKIHIEEFNNTITARVPRQTLFTKTLKQQLLFRAMKMAMEYNIKPYKNNQTAEEVREMWHASSTDVDMFIRDALKFDPSYTASLDDIKNHYDVWCVRNNKKRYVKYLTKKLQPFFRKMNTGNVYSIQLVELGKQTAQQTIDITGITSTQ